MKNSYEKKLVILTTHFGANFSGGSLATCEILSRIEKHFTAVIVIGTELGNHPFSNLTFIKYRHWIEALRMIRKTDDKEVIFYGDFYNSLFFALLGKRFFFTYHDNWPELAGTSFSNLFRSLFYIPVYWLIFKKASFVFSVSEQKLAWIKRFTKKTVLVRNGFNQRSEMETCSSLNAGHRIVMVGAIDHRKYSLAIRLFRKLKKTEDLSIDIYGRESDPQIAQKLRAFRFVHLKGFRETIPYQDYDFLLHTSLVENLPIVFCEAIHANIPVLAFDTGGSGELISHPVNGYLVPPYDLEIMKEWLTNTEARATIQMKTDVLKVYTWERAAGSYLKYFNT